ncbi:MAG: N-acetyltransferase [Chitinophagia bacterium]|nr:N-acetyltransferase [Chitinophagia bacterium]
MTDASDIRIRPWRPDDLDPLVQQANDIRVWNNLRDYFPHPYTENDGQAWIDTVTASQLPVNFAIEADGAFAGGIGLILNGDVYAKSAELGYWVGAAHWGRGVASEAVRQMVEHCFRTFDIVRIYSEVFEGNKASMRVLEKNGFYLEGVRRKAVFKNGVLMDDYIWVLLRPW